MANKLRKQIRFEPIISRVPFGDYRRYPPYMLEAAKFRDENVNLSAEQYIKKAAECGMAYQLVELAAWEANHTE